MTSIGFDKPLYVLPFDHRGSFLKLVDTEGLLDPGQKAELAVAQAEVAAAKGLLYDSFKTALTAGVPKQKACILVDEQFGDTILRDAAVRGYTTACPAEKSGQEEFDFEFGDDFAKHIEAFHPTFCKVLVRYNPEGDEALNRRQSARLKRLSEHLHGKSRSLFMCELLVPAEMAQLDELKGDRKAYDLELRPRLMVEAIQQLQDAEVEPDVWNVEGLDRREDCRRVVATVRRGGRDRVSCIVLGRPADSNQLREWLTTAAAVPGFIGFAVGRTVFWDPVASWLARRTTRAAAVAEVAQRYREFVDIFEKAHVQVRAA